MSGFWTEENNIFYFNYCFTWDFFNPLLFQKERIKATSLTSQTRDRETTPEGEDDKGKTAVEVEELAVGRGGKAKAERQLLLASQPAPSPKVQHWPGEAEAKAHTQMAALPGGARNEVKERITAAMSCKQGNKRLKDGLKWAQWINKLDPEKTFLRGILEDIFHPIVRDHCWRGEATVLIVVLLVNWRSLRQNQSWKP